MSSQKANRFLSQYGLVDADRFLSHHGIKGMRWGIIRSDKKSGGSGSSGTSTSSAKGSSTKTLSDDDAKKALVESFKNKSDKELHAEGKRKLAEQASTVHDHKPEPPKTKAKSGLSKEQKAAIAVGSVAVVGMLAYAGHKHIKEKQLQDKVDFLKKQALEDPNNPYIVQTKANKQKISEAKAAAHKLHSEEWGQLGLAPPARGPGDKIPQWGPGFYASLKNGKAIDRPEFTIPASMSFRRLSNHQETGNDYEKGVYATFLSNDNKQYSKSGEFSGQKYDLSFSTGGDVRVPSTKTVLSSLKKVLEDQGDSYSDAEVVTAYRQMSGGKWSREDSDGPALIKSLRDQGYSAMVDDMDAGFLGDLPLVFFGKPEKVEATVRTKEKKLRDSREALGIMTPYA